MFNFIKQTKKKGHHKISRSALRRKKLRREESIVVTEAISSINECYNTLKDNLLFLEDGGKTKVIQIESCMSSEGKTTLCCNLAVSLSFNEKKIIVIDLDFRKPRVNRLFKVPNESGLVDYISEKIDFDKLIKKTTYKNVDVISRGSPLYNPSLLLMSEKFKELIAKLRKEYDYILLDSPPVLQISDYVTISKVSDCVLFVVAYGQTKKEQAKEAAEMLKKNNIRVIGSVMTFVDSQDPYSYYYGTYRNKYGYDTIEVLNEKIKAQTEANAADSGKTKANTVDSTKTKSE